MTRIVLFGFLALSSAVAQPGDVIFYGGKILTVDPGFHIVDSLAIRGDRIIAAGSRDAVAKFAGPATRRIDLKGKTVLPGLIDTHSHASSASMYEFDHPVPDMETIDDVLRYVRARAAVSKPGDWVVLTQVFITRLREQRFPTRAELDAAAPRNPVYFGTGPDASVNSLALKVSGIDKNYRISDGKPGRIERTPDGEPTGILRSCSRLVKIHSSERKPTEGDRLERLKMMMADYNSVGLTSLSERDLNDEGIELYRKLRDGKQLTCRVFVMHELDAQMPLDQAEERIAAIARSPLHRYDNMLWVRGIKNYMDGGMLTGSAYMVKPWGVSALYSITDPNYRGMRYIDPAKVYQLAKFTLSHDLQYTAHSQGDGAVQAMIDAYAEVNNEFKVRDSRPCITHSSFIPPGSIEKIKTLGIVLDMQPDWLWLDGATLEKQFGNQRMAFFHPYKSLLDNGIVVGGGSDHMQKIGSLRSINPYNPFLGMWITLTRQPRWTDHPLHPEQTITREQAIRLYTINNAFLTFEEKEKGSLETGKLADLVVLDRDILTCPLEDVRKVEAEQTWMGGKLVFERKQKR
jgi:predicted amidohydrolase YtcJ